MVDCELRGPAGLHAALVGVHAGASARLNDCALSGKTGAFALLVQAAGAGSICYATDCLLASAPLMADAGARLELTGCVACAAREGHGVALRGGSRLVARRSHFLDGAGDCVSIKGGSSADLDGCTIARSGAYAGVEVAEARSSATLRL